MSAARRGDATVDPAGELKPGEHLRAEIDRLGLDQIAVSQATGVSRQSINNIVNGRQSISRAMAGKLGRLTGHSSDYWLRESFPRTPKMRVRPRAAEARPLGVGVLVNHQIVRAVKDGIIGIEPFEESNVQIASVDLTLDDFIVTAHGDVVDIRGGARFALKGGRSIAGSTKERLEFPQDYIGRAGAVARLAAHGIIVSHEFQIAPGYKGNLQFSIFNAGLHDFELHGGDPVISVELMPLSATPSYDQRAARQPNEVRARDTRMAAFRGEPCVRIVRDAIRARTQLDSGEDGISARIAELNIDIIDTSADSALDGAVDAALGGLKALRRNPKAAREDRERYSAFFSGIAERIYLSSEQARLAIESPGLPPQPGETVIAVLRNGDEAVVPLPPRSSRIGLRQLARHLREDPLDLLLVLAGVLPQRDETY